MTNSILDFPHIVDRVATVILDLDSGNNNNNNKNLFTIYYTVLPFFGPDSLWLWALPADESKEDKSRNSC